MVTLRLNGTSSTWNFTNPAATNINHTYLPGLGGTGILQLRIYIIEVSSKWFLNWFTHSNLVHLIICFLEAQKWAGFLSLIFNEQMCKYILGCKYILQSFLLTELLPTELPNTFLLASTLNRASKVVSYKEEIFFSFFFHFFPFFPLSVHSTFFFSHFSNICSEVLCWKSDKVSLTGAYLWLQKENIFISWNC